MTQRSSAIQSIAVLLNQRQKQQELLRKEANYFKEEKLVTRKYSYYDQNEKPKSILKGKSDDENDIFLKEENKLNNNSNLIYSRKSMGEHQRQISDEKNCYKQQKHLNNSNLYLSNKLDKIVDENNNYKEEKEEENFLCCSVCGGRIWSGDEKSTIFGFEELFVHCACFQCATCGMDLADTPEEQVYKQNGRFYCQVHGPLALKKNKNNMEKMLKNEEKNSQLEWWERNTNEFNGSKKSSTIVRFYGEEKEKQATKNNNGAQHFKSIKTAANERQTLNKLEAKQNTIENTKENKLLKNSACFQSGKYNNTKDDQNTINSACFQKYNSKTNEEQNKNKLYGQRSNKLLFDNNSDLLDSKLCYCGYCNVELNGSFVLAKGRAWCPEHFCCANSACSRPLMDSGFVEDPESRRNYCPKCYEVLLAPICFKCSLVLNESCINALGQKWHPECFCCTHCHKPLGASSFFVEDGKPYCDDDWNELFTTKCIECKGPIKVGQKWLEALGGQPFHAECFRCSTCKTVLDGKIFFERKNRPYCRLHAIKAAIADSERKIG